MRQASQRLPEGFRPLLQQHFLRPQSVSAGHNSHQHPQSLPTNSAIAAYRGGEAPTDKHFFQVTWATLLSNLHTEGLPESREARNRLDQICNQTETYIPTPQLDSVEAKIFGNAEHVITAKQQLDLFEKDIRAHRRRKHEENWIKQNALDGRKDHREKRQNKTNESLKWYEQQNRSIDHDFEDYIFWPSHLDLEQFAAEYETSVFLDMRREYDCHITFNTSLGLVRISAPSEKRLMMVHGRVVNLVKELVARLNQGMKLNLIRLPSSEIFRSKVALDQPRTDASRPNAPREPSLPSIFGEALPKSEEQQWEVLRRQADRENRRLINLCLNHCLTTMQIAKQHVRMRLTFGELGFTRHRKPPNENSAYEFDEFVDMLRNEKTLMKSQGLRSTGGDMSLLPDALDQMQEVFCDPVESYTVHFDFQKDPTKSTLRLECEFQINHNNETERTASRWLLFDQTRGDHLLEMNMLEFEKPDWTLSMGAVPLYEISSREGRLETFAHTLDFRVDKRHSQKPQRGAIYPPGNDELVRLTEITCRRYRFKNTDGILELRRKEFYDVGMKTAAATPISVTWNATYYYQEWDHLLGQLASLEPGEQVRWELSLPTFFPDSPGSERPDGFRRFMREVEEIQGHLGEAISGLAKEAHRQ